MINSGPVVLERQPVMGNCFSAMFLFVSCAMNAQILSQEKIHKLGNRTGALALTVLMALFKSIDQLDDLLSQTQNCNASFCCT